MGGFAEWFRESLYRSYHQGAGVGYFLKCRITAWAWFIMGLLGVSMVMGGNIGRSLVIILSGLVLGVLVSSLVWVFFRKASLRAERILPQTGSVGEELVYRVRVENVGKRELPDFRLFERDDDPRPTAWEFENLKEPGESQRNFFDRFFLFYRWKWLVERGGRWRCSGVSEAMSLESEDVAEVRMSLVPFRRGVIRLNEMRVVLPDPFGLFQRCRVVGEQSDEILVVPRRYRLPQIYLGGESELKVGGETASVKRGEGGEFLGLREYRPGDPMRKIHWKSWARTGTPVVKEHEEYRFARYGLILDTSLRGSGPNVFEECVSVAASFVSTMDRNQCLLDLMFVRNQPQVFTAGRGVAKASKLMEVLARVEASDQVGYEELARLVGRYSADLSAAVVVLSGWDEEREGFIDRLLMTGLKLHVYAVVSGNEKIDSKIRVHALRWNRVERDLLASG